MPLVFANPMMLIALAAAGLPLIIHLISRQRARRLPISTLRFLLQTDRKTARKHKLVDLIVLALRTALLLFLALALSKPYLQPRRQAGDLAPAQTAWAIVIDDSYSMGLVADGLTVFDRAIAAASDILKNIPDGDEIHVVLTSGRQMEGLGASTYRTAAAIEALRRLDGPSYGDAQVASGLEQGVRFLEAATHPNHALVLISDFQSTALRDTVAAFQEKKDLPKSTGIYWLDVGQLPDGNTAVQSVRVYQAMPFVGMPMQVRAALVNYGDKPARQTASLWIGVSKIESQEVEIAPDSLSEVEFQHVPLEAGNIAGDVRLEGDPLPADNRRCFAWYVTGRVQAVVIHGGSAEQTKSRRWDDVFFLKSVFEPVVEDAKAGRPRGLQVSYVNVKDAGKINWQDLQIAFVVGVDRLEADLASRLDGFAKRGGSVIAFAGGPASGDQPSSPLDPDVVLLGASAGDVRTETAGSTGTLTLGQVDEQHPIFRTLTRTAAANLSVIEFYVYRRLAGAAVSGASRVVASYENGDPFLVERRVGSGRILVFETRCHSDWSNLPTRPLFLPLIYETMKYCVVSQLGLQGDLAPGTTYRYAPPEGTKITRAQIKDPEGRMRDLVSGERSEAVVLDRPGIYHIYSQSGAAESDSLLAVNVNPDEGRIARLNDDELAKQLEPARVHIYSSASSLTGMLRRQREGVALRSILLYLAAMCFLAEVFLANYLIPKEHGAAREKAAPAQSG